LHEARHTFASLMIAADVNAKALAAYMGHSSVTITLGPLWTPDAGRGG
jgi:integrase